MTLGMIQVIAMVALVTPTLAQEVRKKTNSSALIGTHWSFVSTLTHHHVLLILRRSLDNSFTEVSKQRLASIRIIRRLSLIDSMSVEGLWWHPTWSCRILNACKYYYLSEIFSFLAAHH